MKSIQPTAMIEGLLGVLSLLRVGGQGIPTPLPRGGG